MKTKRQAKFFSKIINMWNVTKLKKIRLGVINTSKNPLPSYGSLFASGFDIRADLEEPLVLQPGKIALVPTGLHFEIPPGYELQIRSRSGLASKGIIVLNQPGTVDADYRGEVKVILYNASENDFVVNPGDRIAQGVIAKVFRAVFVEEKELEATERGEKGFGSTGIK